MSELFPVAVDCFSKFVTYKDWPRAAYWMATLKYLHAYPVPTDLEQMILGASFRDPDYATVSKLRDAFVTKAFQEKA